MATMDLDTDQENENNIEDNDNDNNMDDGFGNDDDDFDDGDDDWGDDGDGGDDWGDAAIIDPVTNTTKIEIDTTKSKDEAIANAGSSHTSLHDNNENNIIGRGGQIAGMASVQHRIPKSTTNALTNNCIEINMIPMFVAKADLKSRSRIGAMIGIRINQLTNLTRDQLEVWGISPNYQFIALKFEFGVFYLNEGEAPSLQVGLSERLNWEEPLKEFRLSWTIGERIKNSLLSNEHWEPGKIDLQKIPDASKINDLMESSEKEYSLCLEVLKQTKFDSSAALNLMFDESQVKRVAKKLISKDESQVEFENILGKVWQNRSGNNNNFGFNEQKTNVISEYEKASDAAKITQLAEIGNVSFKIAKFAYETHGYDGAVAKMTDATEKASIVATFKSIEESNAKKNNANVDKVSDFFQSYSESDNKSKNKNNNSNNNGKVKSKITNLFSIGGNKNNNSNDNTHNNDNSGFDVDSSMYGDFAFEEKSLDVMSEIKRTKSENIIQQIRKEDLIRTIATMSKHNWLLRVLCFALKVLLNGNKFCMICDEPLAFAGLKPSICDKPFCQFRHDEMELGFSLADEIIHRPEMLDLLISMCYAACKAGRYQDFFPYGVRADTLPSSSNSNIDNSDFTDTNNNNNNNTNTNDSSTTTTTTTTTTSSVTNTTATAATASYNNTYNNNLFNGGLLADMDSFMTNDSPDPQKVIQLIDACPEVRELQEWALQGKKFLKLQCYNVHPLLYHFLSWVVTSNRSHLKLLSEEERIKDVDTPYQFAMCSSTPQREAEFQRLQHENSSFLAWHGSGFGNWHSILRMGLKNYSGTKNQVNGAAYGNGIYLGATFGVSWGYCARGTQQGWSKSQFGTNINCMALCEVCYHHGDAPKHKNKNTKSASAVDINSLNNLGSNTTKSKAKSTVAATPQYDRFNRIKDPNNRWLKTSGIYVVADETHVITRFFMIFANSTSYGTSKNHSQNANDIKIPQVVKSFD